MYSVDATHSFVSVSYTHLDVYKRQAVDRIARAFDMPVVFENRSPKPQLEGDGVRQAGLDELLATADVVSLHCLLYTSRCV